MCRPEAEKYGICKIVPPKIFKMPFSIENMTDFKFKARKQKLNLMEMENRLRLNYEKHISLTPNVKDAQLRPWLAPELLGTSNSNVYSKAVDVYALGWMILQICTFCEEFSSVHETGWESTNEASQIQHISLIVKSDYYVYEKRKSLDDLDKKLLRMRLEPTKCLRPTIEMMPDFY